MRVLFDTHFMLEKVIIEPGEYHTADNSRVIFTILGSCIAVCLKDEQTGLCGMNHFMLPAAGSIEDKPEKDWGKYGVQAMNMLIREMVVRGASKNRLWAKVFGGGQVLRMSAEGRAGNVSRSNIEFAERFLDENNIPILGKDVGGTQGRKIHFFTRDGRVAVEKLEKSLAVQVVKQEATYKLKLSMGARGPKR